MNDDGGGPAGEDILEHGPDRPVRPRWPSVRRRLPVVRRPSRPTAILGAAGLVVGLVAGLAGGYAAGDHHGRSSAPTLSPAAISQAAQLAAGGGLLSQSGATCAAQVDGRLQLGVQVTNVSALAVALRQVRAILPIGGLKAVAQAWGTCGELAQPAAAARPTLYPGESTWFTVTFTVLIRCPGPIPVQFALDYVEHGRAASARLPGFDDLTQVTFPGCA
jgi:hypothetical protein